MGVKIQTWRNQIIEVIEDDEYLSIHIYSLPWILELILWYFPIFLFIQILNLTYKVEVLLKLLIIFILIIVLKIISMVLGYRSIFDLMIHWNKFLAMFHYRFGRRRRWEISTKKSFDSTRDKNENALFLDDLKGICYLGNVNKSEAPSYDFYSCQICLITSTDDIIRLGGFYGEFLMGNQAQRNNFKELMTKLKSHLGMYSSLPLNQDTFPSYSARNLLTIWKLSIGNVPCFIAIALWILAGFAIPSLALRVEIARVFFYPLIEITLTRWVYDVLKFVRWVIQEEDVKFFKFNEL
ncbi:MAG: hypothetical protein ACFE8U_17160 [Candidatus Hermodarchaeota archaeon]